jgi:hypothetical protein
MFIALSELNDNDNNNTDFRVCEKKYCRVGVKIPLPQKS